MPRNALAGFAAVLLTLGVTFVLPSTSVPLSGATPPATGNWEVASDGGAFAFGNASYFGSIGGQSLNKPIVGMAATPNGGGYWLVASDGGVFDFDGGYFCGSPGGQGYAGVVGMALNAPNQGYWLAGSDGAIFLVAAYCNAPHYGSLLGTPLNAPIVGIAQSSHQSVSSSSPPHEI
jgi:hypothetical protein